MKEIPVFGAISRSGKEWSVTFEPERWKHTVATGSVNGYGEFPVDRYPGIPIIDFTGCTIRTILESLSGDPVNRPGQHDTPGDLSLYLWEHRILGIPVRRA